ncbi:MAG TPA: tRNA lysidine(34) synthetase TilS [Gemmataceae bacterium]|jgi:tRNA(Ile)-lysidine synthase|nr:tRNA lysidine(34) synthetase TilS [Gemmataceae bacterium]
MTLLEQVRRMLTRLQVEPSGCVVAVSGGADSVALLRALLALRGNGENDMLVIAHLNHGLRGDESDGDEQFVRNLHQELSCQGTSRLEIRCERIDMAARARALGDNLEAVARRERYRWLAQVARDFGLNRVATGHTADDQAETVLHRLLRGSGLQGLRGIAPRRTLGDGVEVMRPLLTATRADVLEFLQSEGQPFREDRSNADLRFTRNRIRHQLLPLLQQEYNPDVAALLCRLAEQANEVYGYFEEQASQLLRECELPAAGEMRILNRSRLAHAPRHLIREAVRLLWQRSGWSSNGMRFTDWDRIAGVVVGEIPALDLPGNIHVRAKDRVVQIEKCRAGSVSDGA